jgi:DNA adenine methylase
MTEVEHQELLDVLRGCRGKVILSAYPSEMYDQALADWSWLTKDIANHSAGGQKKERKTEVL